MIALVKKGLSQTSLLSANNKRSSLGERQGSSEMSLDRSESTSRPSAAGTAVVINRAALDAIRSRQAQKAETKAAMFEDFTDLADEPPVRVERRGVVHSGRVTPTGQSLPAWTVSPPLKSWMLPDRVDTRRQNSWCWN
mmetsp:Transcript_85935/g.135684  ORF Transcript_85935/g.135684 Transcript_85935/m.135684 type:complete len:138 (-) Transcript_85935:206-619(-)